MAKRKESENSTTYAAPAVDMALDVVEFLAENHGPFGINELARRLGLAVNSTYRVLMRLANRGYVELDPVSNGYQLSTRLFSLGIRLHDRFELRARARRHLEALSDMTEELCQIQILQGARMLALDSVAPQAAFYLRVVPGNLFYCHANAHGKAVLAFLPADRLTAVAADGMPRLTDNTITDIKALSKDLEKTRLTGLAYDHEEYCSGICCIVAPVFGVTGEVVASAGITGLASRVHRAEESILRKPVLECAAAISADIGYTGDLFDKWTNRFGSNTKARKEQT